MTLRIGPRPVPPPAARRDWELVCLLCGEARALDARQRLRMVARRCARCGGPAFAEPVCDQRAARRIVPRWGLQRFR